MSSSTATLIGFGAILLWSSLVAFIRIVSDSFGAVGGAALVHSAGAIVLLLSVGFIPLKKLTKTYLYGGGFLFVVYEICLYLAVGLAQTPRQAIEVGMINYLWPALVILFLVIFNHQQTTWLLAPGFILALLGMAQVVSGDAGFDIKGMLHNIALNPLSYALALAGAFIWASYCTLVVKTARGQNAVTLFFIVASVALWIQYFITDNSSFNWSISATIIMLIAGAVTGLGYAAWNIGILHGNVSLLAGASYFIPVISALIASFTLNTKLPLSFWYGALMVCAGSILCWLATRQK